MTTTTPQLITGPGIYEMDAETYHADPVAGGSLSSSGARLLLPPSCPAKFRWHADNPTAPKRHYDVGHAAHKLVLGVGPELAVLDYENYQTKAARAERDAASADGAVPLLVADYELVEAMATALRAHPVASLLFDPRRGAAEQTLVWTDAATGVRCRALLDWLPDRVPGQRLIVPDYKTARSADPDTFGRTMQDYGYHLQDAWYQAGCHALGLADADTAFVFVVQEKDPPYLVTIVEPDHVAHRIGQLQNRQALDLYARCRRDNTWPAYADDVMQVSLPRWVEREWEDLL